MRFIWIFLWTSTLWAAEPKAPEASLNEILCPRTAESMLQDSKRTFQTMDDYFLSLQEQRTKAAEFHQTYLELDKTKAEHELAAKQMQELGSGNKQKVERALTNYNDQLKSLSVNLPKARKCWGYHTTEQKNEISRYLELFQTKKVLSQFKDCSRAMVASNRVVLQQVELSRRYYLREVNKTLVVTGTKKLDVELKKLLIKENRECQDFATKGKFYGIMKGTTSSEAVNRPLIPTTTPLKP